MPVGRLQEMRTMAAALAESKAGKHKALLDILAQRFIALEARAMDKSTVAPGLKLADAAPEGLASSGHIRIATNELNRNARLQNNIDRLRRRP